MATGRFIPDEELKRLTSGSHECFINEVKAALATGKRRLFGDDVTVEVLATFPKKALVLVDNKRVAQISLRRAGDGYISLDESKDVAVQSYDRPSSYFSDKLETAAANFLAGNLGEAKEALRGAALTETVAFFSSEPTYQSIIADRPWKQLYQAKTAEIEKTAGKVESDLEAKFDHVLKNGFAGLHLDNYKALILKDFGHLVDEVSTLSENVRSASDSIRNASADGEDAALVTSFASFATDLDFDLRQHNKSLKAVAEHSSDIKELAKLYDALASQWGAYKTAATFVEKLAGELRGEGNA